MSHATDWFLWSLLSAAFAALTAIFATIGLEGVDSDLAPLIRTVVIFFVLVALGVATGKWNNPTVPSKTWPFLVLSRSATGASWVCYFRALKIGDASKVAPVDELPVALVALFAVLLLGERPSLRKWSGLAPVALGVGVLAIKRRARRYFRVRAPHHLSTTAAVACSSVAS